MTEKAIYEKLTALFSDVDEKQRALVDGAIRELAGITVELTELRKIAKATGHIRINPKNPLQQKEMPISRVIVRQRANYLNYIAKLSSILGRNISEEMDELEREYGDG
ncbi:MAG: hypothetical protein LBP78_06745 [Acidaminococcales bacterium]|nr:hypothetical protein [Acidaminococcales bacterium]